MIKQSDTYFDEVNTTILTGSTTLLSGITEEDESAEFPADRSYQTLLPRTCAGPVHSSRTKVPAIPHAPAATLAPRDKDALLHSVLPFERIRRELVVQSFTRTISIAEQPGVKFVQAVLAMQKHFRPLIFKRRVLRFQHVHMA
jgi:hypothetical protein